MANGFHPEISARAVIAVAEVVIDAAAELSPSNRLTQPLQSLEALKSSIGQGR
jgi:HAMP domain-containing protein